MSNNNNDGVDKVSVTVGGGLFHITGKDFKAMLGDIKQVDGRRYDPDNRTWNLPIAFGELEAFTNSKGLDFKRVGDAKASNANVSNGSINILLNGVQGKLSGKPFQYLMGAVKALPDREFNKDAKVWEIGMDSEDFSGFIKRTGIACDMEGDDSSVPAQQPITQHTTAQQPILPEEDEIPF